MSEQSILTDTMKKIEKEGYKHGYREGYYAGRAETLLDVQAEVDKLSDFLLLKRHYYGDLVEKLKLDEVE